MEDRGLHAALVVDYRDLEVVETVRGEHDGLHLVVWDVFGGDQGNGEESGVFGHVQVVFF